MMRSILVICLYVLCFKVIPYRSSIIKIGERKEIIGGYSAKQGEFTYQVSLTENGINLCGGGVIADQFILTAAHCVIDCDTGSFEQDKLTAVIGTIDLSELGANAIKIDVEKMFVPRKFKPELDRRDTADRTKGDIAVLKLIEPIHHDHTSIQRLKLPEGQKNDYIDKTAYIAGFGFNVIELSDGNYVGGSYGKMRYGKAKIISKQECRDVTPKKVHDTDICARIKQHENYGPEGVCNGDSGSPLVHGGDTVIGVLSANPGDCQEDIGSGVYTSVSEYRKFIENAMKDIETHDMRVATWMLLHEGCDNPKLYLQEH